MPALQTAQTSELVKNAANHLQIELKRGAEKVFSERSDGTPELVWLGLNQVRQEGKTTVNKAEAEQTARRSVAEAWAVSYRQIVEKHPAAASLIEALRHFHAAEVRMERSMVLAYARSLPPRYLLKQLGVALEHLQHFGVSEKEDRLTVPDTLIAEVTDPAHARNQLTAFLTTHRRWLHNRWLRRFNKDGEAQQWAIFDLVKNMIEQKEYKSIVELYSTGLAISPHAWLYNNRGNAHSALGQHDQAIFDYNQAIDFDTEYAAAYNNRGATQYDLGRRAQAISDFSHAIELDTRYAAAYNNRGVAYRELKHYEQAIVDCDRAIELNPKYADAYNNRGLVHRDLNQYERAIVDFTTAILLDPNLDAAYINQKLTYEYLSQSEQNITDYIRIIEPNQDDVNVYNNRGGTFLDLKQYHQAIADYTRAIELDPSNAAAYNNRGNAHRDLKQHKAAIADYDEAITLDPKYALAYSNRGNARYDLKEYAAAIADYDQSIALDPKYAAAYYNRGFAQSILKRWTESLENYRHLTTLTPHEASAWNSLAQAARRLGDEAEYRHAIEQARPLVDESDMYNVACFYSVAGEPDRAFDLLAQLKVRGELDVDWARRDPDLHWLRGDPRFAAIVGEVAKDE